MSASTFPQKKQTNFPSILRFFFLHPLTWILAALAILGDTTALFQFRSMFPPLLTGRILLFLLLTLFAESTLLFTLTQYFAGSKNNLIDAIMSPLTLLPKLFLTKMLLLIPSALLILLFLILSPLFEGSILSIVLFSVFALPFLFSLNIVTVIAFILIFSKELSIGEAISQAGWIFRQNFGRFALISLPFLIIEGFLLFFLLFNASITYDSAFIYTVTPEMADYVQQFANMSGFGSPRFSQPGDYFIINRPLNGLVTTVFKTRGPDLLSPFMFTVNNEKAAYLILAVNFFLIPIRLGILSYFCLKKL
ncbi:MAG: hypothetical protein CL609_04940 [Anaerolineaceae bacterium]|nr:hypothetical protein [Anaerolineaceae bacterium]